MIHFHTFLQNTKQLKNRHKNFCVKALQAWVFLTKVKYKGVIDMYFILLTNYLP